MAVFADSVEFVTMTCGGCGVLFAFSRTYYEKRREDRKTWHCPNGCVRHFTGQTEAEKLQQEVERQKSILDAERARAARVEQERDQVARAHNRMRSRVFNGVCPCCNRTFQNLMAHMKTEHEGDLNLSTLRQAFGMTQAQVAEEAGVEAMHVSLHERGRPVAGWAKSSLDGWVDRQAGRAKQKA